MDGIDIADASQKIRTMCSNWYFAHYTDDCKKLSMVEWMRFRKDLYKKLINHEQYNTVVKPLVDELYEIQFDPELYPQWFDKTQTQVFRILDMINREEKLLSDF